ncbi:MAG TPA: DUF4012 domain-containing protein, partial [Ktedonobacteraceae bacterium]|nr:DUF4012 domain-containing protein [Ktedonobacteraceae bacterium]
MFKLPGRKRIRPPFPPDQRTQTSDAPFHGTPAAIPEEENRPLADLETQKTPTISPEHAADQSALTNLETQKHPALPPDPARSKNLFLANAIMHYRASQKRSTVLTQTPALAAPNASQQKKKRAPLSKRRKVQLILAALLLGVPLFLILFELISMALFYRQMQDGIAHLEAAGTLFYSDSNRDIANYFNTQKLSQAQQEITLAHSDFVSLSDMLDHEGLISLAANLLPSQIQAARSLGHIAATGTDVAQQLLKMMQTIAPSIAPALQKSTSVNDTAPLKPYLTSSSYQIINTTIALIAPNIHMMTRDARGLSLDALPMSSKQHEMIASVLTLLPILDAAIPQLRASQAALGWFLGIDSQRSFLIEPMDSAELRATGGFTGQFGELTLSGAHVGPLKLANIGVYEEDHTAEGSPPDATVYARVAGQSAPEQYANWWPVANFGLRDANLSADFPTSARLAMDRYRYEFGKNVDGVMMFTSALIKYVLEATGPINIPAYKRTITSQNLESLLHYYQLDNKGISEEQHIEHVQDSQVARKLFTQRLTQALITTVTHLPLTKMLALANKIFFSMKTRDLQIYVTNPQLNSLIQKYGST